MKNLNQKQMLGVAAALVVVGIFLLSRSFVFSFFTQNVGSGAGINNETNMTMTDQNGGLKIVDVVVGGGATAVAGKTIVVNYTGKLLNGVIFDSSYPRGQAFEFVLGAGQVISGWDMGVAGMKVGGKRTLTIPADLAYGDRAVGDVIPANSTLIFDVELVDVR